MDDYSERDSDSTDSVGENTPIITNREKKMRHAGNTRE